MNVAGFGRCRGSGAVRRGVLGRAFTLIEMLVVIIIIVLILSISIPAFSNMLYSQEETAAESQLQAAVSSARDAAIRGGPGQDSAAVFTFDAGGRLTVITAVKVGRVHPPVGVRGNDLKEEYEVFAPVADATPVQLPQHWMVRGYAPPGAVDEDWYGPRPNGAEGYYSGGSRSAAVWVAPETGFYDHSQAQDTNRTRSTFMLRFAGGSGTLSGASMEPVLVVLPRPSYADRGTGPQWLRADRAEDLVQWARRVLTSRLTPAARWDAIGRFSTDVAAAKPVQMIALYDESRLARGLGVSLDRVSRSLMAVDPQLYNNGRRLSPAWVSELSTSGYAGQVANAINRWIEGYADLSQTSPGGTRADSTSVKLFAVSRYVGSLQSLAQPRAEEVSNP